jgi:hypothetical protein
MDAVTQAVGAPRELNSVGERTAYVLAVPHFIAADYSTRRDIRAPLSPFHFGTPAFSTLAAARARPSRLKTITSIRMKVLPFGMPTSARG